MFQFAIGLVITGTLWTLNSAIGFDDLKQEAIQKDYQILEGRWQVVEMISNGDASEPGDVMKIVVVNGPAGEWSVEADGREIAKGTSSIDPSATPRSIDFTIKDGEGKNQKFLGIYELSQNSRKLCFVPADLDRPEKFASPRGSRQILLKLERKKDSEKSQ